MDWKSNKTYEHESKGLFYVDDQPNQVKWFIQDTRRLMVVKILEENNENMEKRISMGKKRIGILQMVQLLIENKRLSNY